MSYIVSPYAVDLDGIRLVGSYGQEFVDAVVRSSPQQVLDRLDEAEELGLTPRDVMRQLLAGEPMDPEFGPTYGHALEVLCHHAGTLLDNAHWAGMRFRYFSMVEQALADIGVDFDPTELVLGGAPIELPPIDDFPSIGFVEHHRIDAMADTLNAVRLDRLTDDAIRGSVAEMREWARTCQAEGVGLVCFYY
ncbi:hypothetical protein GFY24_08770 [Nocardia sp. SYP-A9097]|uniref:DUF7691 family protein n=1 Tax=Nocardia sp. SYP-A9097 TaxID=2663237 RepID=UPI00129BEE61|nr:hypothetical protein [Nocardia sp. SYP-A9097]MRH87547.1 hypothetical protein [Nocardia sp. SYP-A9097]